MRRVVLAAAGAAILLLPLIGCASGVPEDPDARAARAEQMRRDCERRGGQWYPTEMSCVGGDRTR